MMYQQNIIVNINMKKECASCKQAKCLTEFWKRERAKDGYNSSCINCVRIQNQSSYKNHWAKNRKRIDSNNFIITEKLREQCNQIKHSIGCLFCKESDPVCLDFHHKDKTTKVLGVSNMIGRHRPWSVIENEISKCVVICANCHRKIHAGNITLPI